MKPKFLWLLLPLLTSHILVTLALPSRTTLCNHLTWPQQPFCMKYPLHWAATTSKAEIVENLLLNGGENVNQKTGRGYTGNTALHIASRYGRAHVVRVLIKHGADDSIRNNKGEVAKDRALIKWCNFDKHNTWCSLGDHDYRTTLALLHNGCASSGCATGLNCVAHRCLEQSTHENLKNTWSNSGRDTEVVSRQIRDVCGPITWYWWSNDRCQNYRFHWASVAGDETKVVSFLRKGSIVDLRDGEKYTPLMLAGWAGRARTVSLLLKNGADTSLTNNRGQTALLLAIHKFCRDPNSKGCRLGEVDYAESVNLLRQGCSASGCTDGLHCKGGKCQTQYTQDDNASSHKKCGPHIWADWSDHRCEDFPFHWAALIGNDVEVSRFLKLTSVDIRDGYDHLDTPLMHAAWAGHASTVSLLLDHGADASLTNARGQTALELAIEKVCRDSWPGCRLGEVDYDETLRILRLGRTSSSSATAVTVSGSPCVRFLHQGTWYDATECKCCSNSKPWCATDISAQGFMVNWGYCKPHYKIRPLLEKLVQEHEHREQLSPVPYTGY